MFLPESLKTIFPVEWRFWRAGFRISVRKQELPPVSPDSLMCRHECGAAPGRAGEAGQPGGPSPAGRAGQAAEQQPQRPGRRRQRRQRLRQPGRGGKRQRGGARADRRPLPGREHRNTQPLTAPAVGWPDQN